MSATTRTLDLPDAASSGCDAFAQPAHRRERAELPRYDLLALAAEAAADRVYDESAKVRVTQEDIRKLLERRRKERR